MPLARSSTHTHSILDDRPTSSRELQDVAFVVKSRREARKLLRTRVAGCSHKCAVGSNGRHWVDPKAGARDRTNYSSRRKGGARGNGAWLQVDRGASLDPCRVPALCRDSE